MSHVCVSYLPRAHYTLLAGIIVYRGRKCYPAKAPARLNGLLFVPCRFTSCLDRPTISCLTKNITLVIYLARFHQRRVILHPVRRGSVYPPPCLPPLFTGSSTAHKDNPHPSGPRRRTWPYPPLGEANLRPCDAAQPRFDLRGRRWRRRRVVPSNLVFRCDGLRQTAPPACPASSCHWGTPLPLDFDSEISRLASCRGP